MLQAPHENIVGFNSEKLQFKQTEVVLWSHSTIERNPASWKQTWCNTQHDCPIQAQGTSNHMHSRMSVKLICLSVCISAGSNEEECTHFKWDPYQDALDKMTAELFCLQIYLLLLSNNLNSTVWGKSSTCRSLAQINRYIRKVML